MSNYAFHHIHHETVDVDATTAFYTDNFNAEISERIERDGVQWARLKVGGVALFVTNRGQFDIKLGSHNGIDHFCLHTDNFDATIACLKANDVNFVVEPRSPRPGTQLAFVSGPDNMKIEILSVEGWQPD